MYESNIDGLKIPLEIYVKDQKGNVLNNKEGREIVLYKGMDNAKIIEFDYAYSYDKGFVLNEDEQQEKIQELRLPEECY